MKSWRVPFVLILCAVYAITTLLGGCSKDDDNGNGSYIQLWKNIEIWKIINLWNKVEPISPCSNFLEKLSSCGLDTFWGMPDTCDEDRIGYTPFPADDKYSCFLDAECPEIVEYFCDSTAENALTSCLFFYCGNGKRISTENECDGRTQCFDGSDEHAGCPADLYFTCADGERITKR